MDRIKHDKDITGSKREVATGIILVFAICLMASCIPIVVATVWISTHFNSNPGWASSEWWVYSLSGGFFIGTFLLIMLIMWVLGD